MKEKIYYITRQRNYLGKHYSIELNNGDFIDHWFDNYEDAKEYAEEKLEPKGYKEG